MNSEQAQIVALIAYGNEYLSSAVQEDGIELFPSHSTFRNVAEVSFRREKALFGMRGISQTIARDTRSWFSQLKSEGVQNLRLGLLNTHSQLPQRIASAFRGGSAWVIQTDQRRCWQAVWSVKNRNQSQNRIWAVQYWDIGNPTVMTDFPDMESVSLALEKRLVEARSFSEKCKLEWGEWFAEAIELLRDSAPVPLLSDDILPPGFDISARRLVAAANYAWVFGGMGSWNDITFNNPLQEKEYQQISEDLYRTLVQSVGAAINTRARLG